MLCTSSYLPGLQRVHATLPYACRPDEAQVYLLLVLKPIFFNPALGSSMLSDSACFSVQSVCARQAEPRCSRRR